MVLTDGFIGSVTAKRIDSVTGQCPYVAFIAQNLSLLNAYVQWAIDDFNAFIMLNFNPACD